MRKEIGAAALMLSVLTACTSVSEVTEMGKDTYMVGSEARGGFTSQTEVAQIAVKRANSFCKEQGKVMTPTHISNSGVRGWTPQETQFMFACVDATDPAYHRPVMKADPTAVVEIR